MERKQGASAVLARGRRRRRRGRRRRKRTSEMGRIEGGGGGAFAHHHAQMGSLAVQGRGKKKREPASSNQVKEALYSREVVTL